MNLVIPLGAVSPTVRPFEPSLQPKAYNAETQLCPAPKGITGNPRDLYEVTDRVFSKGCIEGFDVDIARLAFAASARSVVQHPRTIFCIQLLSSSVSAICFSANRDVRSFVGLLG